LDENKYLLFIIYFDSIFSCLEQTIAIKLKKFLYNFKIIKKRVDQKEISELFIRGTLSTSMFLENYEFSLCIEIN
jgi:hypothetical protein